MPLSTSLSSTHYRADLDGLRAVAILCVVLFHAYPQFLPGGLMGVDLFFVLSGYLITQLLQREKVSAIGDFLGFYKKRLQRLYPPLLLFLITILLLAWFELNNTQYSALWAYALSSSLFSTNLYLAVDQGVLSDAYAHNPFLHLWSLGIEGQLYLLWPWLILSKFRLTLAAILSLLSVWFLSSAGVDSWLFYAPSSRLFEMAAGAAIAFYGKAVPQRLVAYSCCLIVGCFISGLILINPYEAYPNVTVFLPLLAAVLLLLTPQKSLLNKALTLAPLVYVGRLSYSWYLWHWGLFSLYQSVAPMWLLIGLSLGLAALSYHFLELPLQRRRRTQA